MTESRMPLLFGWAVLLVFFATGCTTVSPHSVVVGQASNDIGMADEEVFVEEAEACSSSFLIFPSTGDASMFAAMKKLNYDMAGHQLAYITTDVRSKWALFTTERCTVVRAHYVKGPPAESVDLFGEPEDAEKREGWVPSSDSETEPEPESERKSRASSSLTESRIQGDELVDNPEILSKRGIVLGTPVRLRTKSGRTADGIFKSYRNSKLVILVTADAELELDVSEIDWLAKIDASDT